MELCPCGSHLNYDECCEPFLRGLAVPMKAEFLMRSRYTAYSLANIDYIQRTMSSKLADSLNVIEASSWAKNVAWLGLHVIKTDYPTNTVTKACVEFEARYAANGEESVIHEISEFYRQKDGWCYVGYAPEKPVKQLLKRSVNTVGRNDPCSCGSGKKHKKCCLK